MKNSLTKSLICGVMASSIILVNCQPGPKKSAKADKAPAGVTTADKLAAQVANLKGGECSKEFVDAYGSNKQAALIKRVDEIMTKKETLDAAAKTALVNQANELNKSSVDLLAIIEKMTGLQYCYITDAKDKTKKANYVFQNYKDENAKLGAVIAQLTGQENDLQKTAAADKKTKDEKVKVDSEFYVSAELGDLLVASQKENFSIVKGEISTSKDKKAEAEKNKDQTVCLLTEVQGKLEENTKLKILPLVETVSDIEKRKIVTATFQTVDDEKNSVYAFKCLLAASAKNSMDEIKLTLGKHLANKEVAAKVTDSSAVSGDRSVVIIGDKTSLASGDRSSVASSDRTKKPVTTRTTENGNEVPQAASIVAPATTPSSAAKASAEAEKQKLAAAAGAVKAEASKAVAVAKVEAAAAPPAAADTQAKIEKTEVAAQTQAKVQAPVVAVNTAVVNKVELKAPVATVAVEQKPVEKSLTQTVKDAFNGFHSNLAEMDAREKANSERLVQEAPLKQADSEKSGLMTMVSDFFSNKNSSAQRLKNYQQSADATAGK